MYGSGVVTGMIVTITRTVQATILQDQALAPSVFSAAAAGTSLRLSAGLRIGATTALRSASSTSGFVLFAFHSTKRMDFRIVQGVDLIPNLLFGTKGNKKNPLGRAIEERIFLYCQFTTGKEFVILPINYYFRSVK